MVLNRLKSLVTRDRGWEALLAEARSELRAPMSAGAATALAGRLEAAPEHYNLKAKEKPAAAIYAALARWRATGRYERSFDGASDARLQFWEIEHNCAVLPFQRELAREMARVFPNSAGMAKNLNILEHTDDLAPDLWIDQKEPLTVIDTPGAERTIVGFSGLTNICLGVGWTTFYRAAALPARANLVVLRDFERKLHLNGNRAFGGLEATLEGLAKLIDGYDEHGEVIGLGASGGTFGGLTLTSRLPRIRRFVALSGPTSLAIGGEHESKQVFTRVLAEIERGRLPGEDVPALINGSALERIDYFTAGRNAFDMRQMRNLADRCDRVVPHLYETENHSLTDLCIADGRLIRVLQGEDLPPKTLDD